MVVPGAAESFPCDAVGVAVYAGQAALRGAAARVDAALGGALAAALAEEKFEATAAATLVLHTHGRIPARRIIAVGMGAPDAVTAETVRRASAAVVRRAAQAHAAHVALADDDILPADAVGQAQAEGALLGAYRFSRYRRDDGGRVDRLTLLTADTARRDSLQAGADRGRIFAEATLLARDLTNEPPNALPPPALADVAAQLAARAGLRCTILEPAQMQELGMNALLAVAAGSDHPARLIVLEYAPADARRTVALVGKGVCFDSGGLNLKHQDLEWMKADMAGGAAVIATLQALPALRPPVRVVGVVPAVENMPGGRAVKPGDIVRASNGTTIEITNTDAEGRLILADALAYAVRQQPDEIVDLATLTGSAMVALGYLAAAIMGNNQALVDRLLQAASRAGERLWQLPLYDEYLEDMRSPVADLRNSGSSRYGGAQKGAIFLREFVGGRPWAHLDIAPTAFLEKEEGTGPYLPKGATGYGVRTLLYFLNPPDLPNLPDPPHPL
ncbi:MAG: leucyl aminopeptidase [Armatimonadota bacterium]|nr:leucyl aminopeptidase [Armatimonadota bacterium]MDR7436878.1 leucyl aminopeptidase [Armatimonadota bacterium]MDR7471581.1 leucyl aminopeptidase [Armatimonadota bacterium]MDR7507583.1 leucyl aminopeptidase [Armatimonadota bacterium]MDR7516931.1 leucyl aminopeptidase [Armatimonadota bacterium]